MTGGHSRKSKTSHSLTKNVYFLSIIRCALGFDFDPHCTIWIWHEKNTHACIVFEWIYRLFVYHVHMLAFVKKVHMHLYIRIWICQCQIDLTVSIPLCHCFVFLIMSLYPYVKWNDWLGCHNFCVTMPRVLTCSGHFKTGPALWLSSSVVRG